ncbi:MAG: sulfite exporter TauE/SafE family protein [Alphaproteobacteria bacterium]|nr:sulfite exporter TauE/SafE family protein [Alphaproteobacteria bacterium]
MHAHGSGLLTAEAFGDPLWLAAVMFLTGLLGGVTHCAAMCGPFVLAQVSAGLEGAGPEYGTIRRLAGAALLPYHLGRFTTYVLLGALGGALSGRAVVGTGSPWLTAGLLAVAALAFIAWSVEPFARLRLRTGWTARAASRFAGPLAPLLGRPTGARSYTLGVVLGLLPCGLLYGALAAAAGSGSALVGGVAMAAFVVGTVPALVGVGYAGSLFGRRWAAWAHIAAPAIMLANAVALLWLAWRQIA